MRWRALGAALLIGVLPVLAACGTDEAPVVLPSSALPSPTGSALATTAPPPTSTPPATSASAPPPATPPSTPPVLPAGGKVVVLDPGHNGANGANPQIVNQPVPDGAGGTKPCNTTGTATDAGFPEHAFTWAVAADVQAMLTAKGVTVVTTRPDDQGVGPCVDKRAAIGNQAAADAVVSIHGDGSAPGNRGFFCMTSSLQPAGAAVNAQSLGLAGKIRDALAATSGLPVSNYSGVDGLTPRRDLAGLNLSTRPTTMCELGNMRSADDAAVMSSESGRAAIAQSIVAGILAYLGS